MWMVNEITKSRKTKTLNLCDGSCDRKGKMKIYYPTRLTVPALGGLAVGVLVFLSIYCLKYLKYSLEVSLAAQIRGEKKLSTEVDRNPVSLPA